jgi:hypothetical protein
MNKKNIIISIVVLIALLVVLFFVYEFFSTPKEPVKDVIGGVNTEQPIAPTTNNNSDSVQVQTEEIKVEETTSKGTLTICLDKCGDGFCQTSDPKCDKPDLNCICLETKADCPQDCK